MMLSYLDVLGDCRRHRIRATITTRHPASSYGQPVIVLFNGTAIDAETWLLLNYQIEKVSKKERPLLDRWLGFTFGEF